MMCEEWVVYNLFLSSPEIRLEITEDMKSFSKELVSRGKLSGFYYNFYNIPPKIPAHIRFGYYKLEDAKSLEKKLIEFIEQGKLSYIEHVQPDLTDVGGVIMDKIKLTARKITELAQDELGNLTDHQASYLIHLSMNPIFGYVNEREIYLLCTALVEEAIRRHEILPQKQWLTFLDNLFPFLKQ